MEQSTGIILNKFFPHGSKIALLDKTYGRVDGIVLLNHVAIGALVHYRMRLARTVYIIDDMNIHEMPMQLARQDILFLHHVLELCCQLIPVNSCVDGIFDLLMYLYSTHIYTAPVQYKKFFLFKLLTTLGIYTSMQKMHESLERLERIPLDSIFEEALDLEIEKELDMWLHYCITEHVRIESLRTIHFLSKNRVP